MEVLLIIMVIMFGVPTLGIGLIVAVALYNATQQKEEKGGKDQDYDAVSGMDHPLSEGSAALAAAMPDDLLLTEYTDTLKRVEQTVGTREVYEHMSMMMTYQMEIAQRFAALVYEREDHLD